MWIATTNGFYSAVQERDDPSVIRVRCRVKDDAEYLVGKLAGQGTVGLPIEEDRFADYLYRVLVPRAAWAVFLMEESLAVDYPNFKNAVADRQGGKRAHVYSGVWSELLDLQETRPWAGYSTGRLPGLDHAYDLTGIPEDELTDAERRFRDLTADLEDVEVAEARWREPDPEVERKVAAQRRRPARPKGKRKTTGRARTGGGKR